MIAIRELKDEDDATFKKKVMDLLASKGSPPDLPAYRLDQELKIHQLHQEPTSVVDMTRDDNSTQQDPDIPRQKEKNLAGTASLAAVREQYNDDDLSFDDDDEAVDLYNRACDIIQSSNLPNDELTVLLAEVGRAKTNLSSSSKTVVRQGKSTLRQIIAHFTGSPEAKFGSVDESKDDNKKMAAKEPTSDTNNESQDDDDTEFGSKDGSESGSQKPSGTPGDEPNELMTREIIQTPPDASKKSKLISDKDDDGSVNNDENDDDSKKEKEMQKETAQLDEEATSSLSKQSQNQLPDSASILKAKENVPVGQDDNDASDMDVDSNDEENSGKKMPSDQKAKDKDSSEQGDLNDQSKDKDSVEQRNLDDAEMEVDPNPAVKISKEKGAKSSEDMQVENIVKNKNEKGDEAATSKNSDSEPGSGNESPTRSLMGDTEGKDDKKGKNEKGKSSSPKKSPKTKRRQRRRKG